MPYSLLKINRCFGGKMFVNLLHADFFLGLFFELQGFSEMFTGFQRTTLRYSLPNNGS
jgi:hypothetical protein